MEKIVIPEEKGVVGYAFVNKIELIENVVHRNPHFLKDIYNGLKNKDKNLL